MHLSVFAAVHPLRAKQTKNMMMDVTKKVTSSKSAAAPIGVDNASVSCSSMMHVSDCGFISCDLFVASESILIMFLSYDSVGFSWNNFFSKLVLFVASSSMFIWLFLLIEFILFLPLCGEMKGST